MKRFSIAVVLSLSAITLIAQPVKRSTISGYVKEASSGESLNGVNVFLTNHKSGTTTNTYGFYSLTLPVTDSAEIAFSYVGYQTEIINVALNKDIELNINLKSDAYLNEVTVTANRREKLSETVAMSSLKLQAEQIKNVPSLLGEKDVMKVLQLMPGVQKGSEGSTGLYVRGGSPDQNLIILDDAIVYNASHLFGFFSLFNGDALKSVELTKGGFPARFGGRLSSVLEMNMKEGNKEKWKSEGGIGLISTRVTVEGPIKKGISSILFSGRRTYADLIITPFMKEEKTGYYFYDLNAKINYDFGRNNKLYLSGYFGKDKFYIKNKSADMQEKAGFLWGNSTATLRWNHLFNNRLFSNTSLIYSNYSFGLFDEYKVLAENKDYYADYYSGIKDFSVKYDIDFLPNPNHWIKAGLISIYHRFNPHAYVEEDIPNNIHKSDIKYTNGIESGIYVEDTWQPLNALKVNAGLRFSHFLATKNQYHFFEPRLSVAWRLNNDIALKGSYSSMNQYIHMLSNTGISLPTDLWVPTTDRIKPQQSKQVALGMVKDFSKNELSFSVEGFYKVMNNVIGYKEGATFLTLDDPSTASYVNWEDNVTSGRAWSYGVEFLLQKKEGRLNGWIGYTLSWTQMQFDSINFGKKYYARYDRRHDISVVATYKLNDHITLSGTWVYGTGNALTLPASKFQGPVHNVYPDMASQYSHFLYYNDLSDKNNFRMAPYHRIDIGIQFHKQKKWGERTWEISIYNVYNRKNPFFYYYYTDQNGTGALKQVSLFPIIPSFTYSYKF
jgi:hypothetical protein